jgi:hypothetical protein
VLKALTALLLLIGSSSAAQAQATSGSLVGHVLVCTVGSERPADDVLVRVHDTDISARTDPGGEFMLSGVPAPAIVTIDAGDNGSGGPQAERFGVPTEPGQLVDVGDVLIGGSPLAGCDDQDNAGA